MNAGQSSQPWVPDLTMHKRSFGLYLHIPFCLRKCLYCSFFSVADSNNEKTYGRYCRALQHQLQEFGGREWSTDRAVGTIFFGGGTPSILPVHLLVTLLESCRKNFTIIDDDIEISVEVNPATVSSLDLETLFQAGFNRLSMGVQSFSDYELQMLGRPHTADDARNTVIMARSAGFVNVSLDLMYGLPGQTVSGWRETLASALALEPDHLSIYELTIEKGTVFADLRHQGRLSLPHEEQVLEMMAIIQDETAKKGFCRYEISNYTRPGKECLHNINYWQNGSYVGAGAGAVSCLSGSRFTGIASIEGYCRKIESKDSPYLENEELDNEARFRETVIMGLRMVKGISLSELAARFNVDLVEYYGPTLVHLNNKDLVMIEGDCLRLTDRGLLFANSVMAELV